MNNPFVLGNRHFQLADMRRLSNKSFESIFERIRFAFARTSYWSNDHGIRFTYKEAGGKVLLIAIEFSIVHPNLRDAIE